MATLKQKRDRTNDWIAINHPLILAEQKKMVRLGAEPFQILTTHDTIPDNTPVNGENLDKSPERYDITTRDFFTLAGVDLPTQLVIRLDVLQFSGPCDQSYGQIATYGFNHNSKTYAVILSDGGNLKWRKGAREDWHEVVKAEITP